MSYDGEQVNIEIHKNTLDCKDFDMRLRRFLLKGMSSQARYDFTGNALDVLRKRAAEVTPETIQMMVRLLPSTARFFEYIWHLLSPEVMDQVIMHDYWHNKENNGNCPSFIEDYCLRYGTTLLGKYDKVPMILMHLLSRGPDDFVYSDANGLGASDAGPRPTPEMYVRYMKKIRKMPRRIRAHYESSLIERLGELAINGKLDVIIPPSKEVKPDGETVPAAAI